MVSMTEIPSDLIPLPTQPWDERPDAIPLDREEVRTALWLTRGNVSGAADTLKVSSQRLRRFVANSPYLSAQLEEARQQLVDIAESNVYDALTDKMDSGRRDSMSRFVLSSQGRSRGWGQGNGPKVNIHNNGPMVIQWADGTSVNVSEDNEKVIEGEKVDE